MVTPKDPRPPAHASSDLVVWVFMGLGIGLVVGTLVGAVFDNVGIGMLLGMFAGAFVGSGLSPRRS